MMNLMVARTEIVKLSLSATPNKAVLQPSSAVPGKKGSKSSLALSIPGDLILTWCPSPSFTLPWCGVPRSLWELRCCDPLRCWGKVPRSVGERAMHQGGWEMPEGVQSGSAIHLPAQLWVCETGESEIAVPTLLCCRGLGSEEGLVILRTKKSALVRYF